MQTATETIPSQELATVPKLEVIPPQNKVKSEKTLIKRDTRFKPGVSGNPSGRPKTAEIRELVLVEFKKNPSKNIQKLKRERIDLFFAYGFGKPVDRLELSGPDGGKIEVHQTSAEDSVKALQAMGIILPG